MKTKLTIMMCLSLLTGCTANKALFEDYKTLEEATKNLGTPDYQVGNRYVWDKRHTKIVTGYEDEAPVTTPTKSAHANSAYMQNKFCHTTVVVDSDNQILLKEVEGGMCKSVYGNMFIDAPKGNGLMVYYGIGSGADFSAGFVYGVLGALVAIANAIPAPTYNGMPPNSFYFPTYP